MNLLRVSRIFFLFALPLAVYSSGSASSLQGKVAEVVDGESIAVISQNHPVKVKLVGVAAPDKSQAFAAIARQHLADLILDKYVVVHVSALRDGYLVGQVQVGDMDVCAQMLRDGVGWYNKSDETSLNEAERQVYPASEEAARHERRGLWQEESPQAPWDFRRAQVFTPTPATASLSRQPANLRKTNGAGLSSEDLMGGVIQPGSMVGKPDIRQLSTNGAQGRWIHYQPADGHFSILAPSDGIEMSGQVLDAQGRSMDLHYIIGVNMSTRAIYLLSWFKGWNGTSTDETAAADAVKGLVAGMNSAAQHHGDAPITTATPGRSLSLNGYVGRQYTLSAGPASGVIRVLSKQDGTQREVFVLGVLNPPGTASFGDEFLNSFKIK